MKIKLFIIAIHMCVSAAWAGPFEDAKAAHDRKDYATAIRLMRPLAAQGYAPGQFNIGVMYSEGKGVEQDYAEAAKWFQLAAAQGHAPAQFNLGSMYSEGNGVIQDYARAHMWYNLASVKGSGLVSVFIANTRDLVASKMTPQQIAEAQKMARDCQARNFKGCN